MCLFVIQILIRMIVLQAESAKDVANNPFVTIRKTAKKGGPLPAKSRASGPHPPIAETHAPCELNSSFHSKLPSEETMRVSEAFLEGSEADRAPLDTAFPTATASDSAAPEALPRKTSIERGVESQPDDSFWTSNANFDVQQVSPRPASELPCDNPQAGGSSEATKPQSDLQNHNALPQQSSAAAEASREPQKSHFPHIVSSNVDNKQSEVLEQAVHSTTKLEEDAPGNLALSQTAVASHEAATAEAGADRTSEEDVASQRQALQNAEEPDAREVSQSLGACISPASKALKVVSSTPYSLSTKEQPA